MGFKTLVELRYTIIKRQEEVNATKGSRVLALFKKWQKY